MGDKGGFPLVIIFDADIVVSPVDVKLSEKFGVPEFVNEVRDKGKGIGITDSVFVQVAIVLAGAKSSILFLNKEKRGCLRGVQGVDLPTFEIFPKKVFHGFLFIGGERVYLFDFRSKGVVKVDFVVIGSG